VSADERLRLLVRLAGEVREIDVLATSVAAPAATRSLGLTLRSRAGVGAEVLRVARGSVADRAGLAPGDVITLIGDVPAPTPARITRSFAALREGQRALIAVTRGDTHRVLTLEP
jgi:S1-C subfamily serine protease